MIYRFLFVFLIVAVSFSFAMGGQRNNPGPIGNARGGNARGDAPPEFQYTFGGGIAPGQLKATWDALPYDSITLERGQCMASCPAYKITLHRGKPSGQDRETYDDRFGLAELHVTSAARARDTHTPAFPEKVGDFTSSVDIWTYGKLSYLLHASKLSDMNDRYFAGGSDERTITVTATSAGKVKTVSDYGMGGPITLWSIEEAIDSIGKGLNWFPK